MRAIDINKFYQYLNWLAAKDISGGYIPPDMFNIAVPTCVNQMVRKYYGIPEQYRPTQPIPSISYEITQLVTDYISQLKTTKVMNIDKLGQASKPADYLHKSSIGASWVEVQPFTVGDLLDETDCCDTLPTTKAKANKSVLDVKWVPVTVVSDANQYAYLQSSLRTPTKEYPICTFTGNDKIQFYPTTIKSVQFTYIRYPKTAKWGYTVDTDGLPVYNPTTSVDIELPEICMDEMAATVLNRLGISIREGALSQWANITKNAGQ